MRSYFEKFEELLDGHTHGPLWLAIPAVAQIVFDAIRYRDGREYRLYSACVMPNHVHLLIHVTQNNIPGRPLFRILQSLKRYTAREANNILARSGPFWQNESYDHVVRNEEELSQLFWYVVFNPVKAGLVGDWKEWRWTYADPEFKAM